MRGLAVDSEQIIQMLLPGCQMEEYPAAMKIHIQRN